MKGKTFRKIMFISYLIISYTVFFIAIKILPFLHFSIDLLLLFTIFNIFISLHFILNKKKMYNFIYIKRYLIGLCLLAFLVIGKYNGSSVELWNNYIEPNYKIDQNIILGKSRSIRSDEWLVSTPTNLSQIATNVNFSSYNNVLGATKNLVTFYPNLPSKDISILATPQNILFFFIDKEMAFSFSWFFPYFLLFFTTFELFMILTRKKLLSTAGAFLVTLSPLIQWWQSPQIVSYGNLAMILFYKLLYCTDNKKKFLLSIALGYSGFLYIMCMYPAWQIPYGYCYLIIIIWMIIKNKEKFKLSDLIYILSAFSVIIGLMVPILIQNHNVFSVMSNTVYPGERMSTGGGHWQVLVTYVLDIFFPYKNFGNPCEYSQYISFFPIPTLYSVYLLVKLRKKDFFIIASTIVILIFFVWTTFSLPSIFSRISLLYMSTTGRTHSVIGYLSLIQLIYVIGNYSSQIKINNWKKIVKNVLLAIIITIIIIITSNRITEAFFPGYVNLYTTIISIIVFTPLFALILINSKKTYEVFCIFLITISILSGAIVSPINKGLDIIYDKPFAKKVRKIVNNNPNVNFLTVDSGITLSNYIVANGGKTINSINYLPNLKLYHILDPKGKYEDIYNRYEHVAVNLVNKKTKFILNQADCITIDLNYDDICKINTDYIVTINDNSEKFNSFKKIYGKYNVKIYQTNCE